jgi:hypothetical protein
MMLQPVNQFASAAAQDLLRTPGTGVTQSEDAAAELLKKKKNASAQTGDNAVISGLPELFGGAFKSLMNKSGNQS